MPFSYDSLIVFKIWYSLNRRRYIYIYTRIPTYQLHHIILETLLRISYSDPIVSVFSVKPLVVPTGGQVQPKRLRHHLVIWYLRAANTRKHNQRIRR